MLLIAGSVSATTIVMPTDAQLVTKSPVIIEGTVVSSQPVDRNGTIWTETIIALDQVIKGDVAGQVIVREVGGELDGRISKVYGAPEYASGERVLAFLTPTPRGDYQTTDLFVGKFTEQRTASGERLWTRDDIAADATLLDHDFRPIAARNVQRRADGFESYVHDRVAGRIGTANYGIENPLLERDIKTVSPRLTGNFTLLAEPTVYRWFAFGNGGSAKWYSNGSQSGYSGGGTAEVQTAMNVWSSYSAAKINYAYSGTTSTMGGLGAPNGVNEILFDDPLNEISGSFNPSTGGVVGQGGFNGVSGGGSWTSPFAADAGHPQQTYTAYNIVEGNLTIQDGVSPSAGISSSVLAEIVAHEFGHTLGFGHSSDATALMYPSVSPGGPSLRADDQVAARWLYPSGTSTPPPAVPNAPTNLTAVPSGTAINLHWTDNASNESGDSVYVATSTGAYSRVGTTAAGATSAAVNGLSGGSYRVYVTAWNAAGESAASNVATATIASTGSAPAAAFSVSATAGTAGQTIFTFTDQSTGTVTSRSWSFGDGATGTAASPSHVYAAAGQYTAVLTVSNNSGSSQASRVITVTQSTPAQPSVSAAFDVTPSGPRAGDLLQFTDRSSGSPTSWSWSFGDGSTSGAQNPAHAYATSGADTVTLSASNGGSTSQISRTITVANAIGTYRSLISAAAQTNGAGGSVWRTELTIFNAGSEGAGAQLVFLPAAGGTVQTRNTFIAPQQTLTWSNALLDIFGMPSGTGAIAIEATSAGSTPNLKLSSRTFTTGSAGTYGQAVPSVTSDALPTRQVLTGIESDSDYRTNIGLVNRSGQTVSAVLTLFDANGGSLGAASITIAPNNFQQTSLTSLWPSLAGASYGRLTMTINTSSASALSAYASVVDNRTQDPVYIQAIPVPGNGGSLVLPAAGRAPGANGTYWRSDVTLYNARGTAAAVYLRFLAAGSDNRNAPFRPYSLAAGQTLVIRDVLADFGLSSGTGALQVFWLDGGSGPVVTSRTYTTVSGGGTFGQSIDPIAAQGYESVVPGLRSDGSFRSNVGLVNSGDSPITAGVVLLSVTGQQLGSAVITLPAKSQMQTSLAAMFPGVNVQSLGSFTLQAHTGDAPTLSAYGSIVDNGSGDPVFFAGQ
jgi:PKD repeat protein